MAGAPPMNRKQRRAAAKNRRRATRQIPPEVQERIRQIQHGEKPSPAVPPTPDAIVQEVDPPPAAATSEPIADTPPPFALPGMEGLLTDVPPIPPNELPPSIQAALRQAQEAAREAGDDAAGKGGSGLTAKPTGKGRAKRFVLIEQELAVLLTLPAPAFEAGGDTYCAQHFSIQGPLLAFRITAYAETHEALAAWLERAIAAGGIAVLAVAIASYGLPPLIHHGLLPAPEGLRRMYGIPPKNEPVEHAPEPQERRGETD